MKICIVGSGIIGSYLGYKLARKHVVSIFEKKKVVGGKACSGLISKRIWNFIPKRKDLVLNKIDFVNVHFPRNIAARKSVSRSYNRKKIGTKKTNMRSKSISCLYNNIKLNFKPKMLVFDRQKLDEYLVNLAEDKGAEIHFGKPVKRVFHVEGKKPQVSVKGNTQEFDLLIGADGANSLVRRQLKLKKPKYRMGIYTYKKYKKISKRKSALRLYNHVDTYATKNGFFWKIPRGKDIEYGIIEKPEIAKDEFIKFCKRFKVKVKKVYSALIPEGPIVSNSERVVLCGDAAGLTKPWSGGGVIWGLTAADMLVNLCSMKNISAKKSISRLYNKKIKRFFGRKIFFSNLLGGVVRKFNSFLPKEVSFDSDFGV